MSRKFFFLTKISLKKKLKSKWFLVVNILLCLAIIALFNINTIITFFGGDFNNDVTVYVFDQADCFPLLEQNIKTVENMMNNENSEQGKIKLEKTEKTEEEMQKELKENAIMLILSLDESKLLTAKVISEEKIPTLTYQIVSQGLTRTKQALGFSKLQIDPDLLAQISSSIEVERVVLNDQKSVDENMDMIMSTVFPTIILPFFMLIIFLVQMVGSEICEEKTTKSMEIIISNVSPKIHLMSKIVASNLFVIIQAFLLFVYGALGFFLSTSGSEIALPQEISMVWDGLVSSGFIHTLIYMIPLALILMLLSFLAYSLVAGILASMTTNMEDFQQIQTPVVLILLVSYYLAIMAGMFQGSAFIKILSYIPFLSCLVSPSLFMMGQIGVMDVLLSIVILIVFIFILLKYGLKVYKNGILNYSNEKVWVRLKKAWQEKDN